MSRLPAISVPDLGAYLREQRQHAQLSLRQLAETTGVSNPYLSQIERGLRRPSAEILQALARGLQISAESLYVRAGLLDGEQAPHDDEVDGRPAGVAAAISGDAALTPRQRQILLDVYASFVAGAPSGRSESPRQGPHHSSDDTSHHTSDYAIDNEGDPT